MQADQLTEQDGQLALPAAPKGPARPGDRGGPAFSAVRGGYRWWCPMVAFPAALILMTVSFGASFMLVSHLWCLRCSTRSPFRWYRPYPDAWAYLPVPPFSWNVPSSVNVAVHALRLNFGWLSAVALWATLTVPARNTHTARFS